MREFHSNRFEFNSELVSRRALKSNVSPIRPEIILGIERNKEHLNPQIGRPEYNQVQQLFRKPEIKEEEGVPQELLGSIIVSMIYKDKTKIQNDVIHRHDPVTNQRIVNMRNRILELVDQPNSKKEILKQLTKLYKNNEDPLIQSLEELPESQVEKLIDILFTVEGKLFKKVNP